MHMNDVIEDFYVCEEALYEMRVRRIRQVFDMFPYFFISSSPSSPPRFLSFSSSSDLHQEGPDYSIQTELEREISSSSKRKDESVLEGAGNPVSNPMTGNISFSFSSVSSPSLFSPSSCSSSPSPAIVIGGGENKKSSSWRAVHHHRHRRHGDENIFVSAQAEGRRGEEEEQEKDEGGVSGKREGRRDEARSQDDVNLFFLLEEKAKKNSSSSVVGDSCRDFQKKRGSPVEPSVVTEEKQTGEKERRGEEEKDLGCRRSYEDECIEEKEGEASRSEDGAQQREKEEEEAGMLPWILMPNLPSSPLPSLQRTSSYHHRHLSDHRNSNDGSRAIINGKDDEEEEREREKRG